MHPQNWQKKEGKDDQDGILVSRSRSQSSRIRTALGNWRIGNELSFLIQNHITMPLLQSRHDLDQDLYSESVLQEQKQKNEAEVGTNETNSKPKITHEIHLKCNTRYRTPMEVPSFAYRSFSAPKHLLMKAVSRAYINELSSPCNRQRQELRQVSGAQKKAKLHTGNKKTLVFLSWIKELGFRRRMEALGSTRSSGKVRWERERARKREKLGSCVLI